MAPRKQAAPKKFSTEPVSDPPVPPAFSAPVDAPAPPASSAPSGPQLSSRKRPVHNPQGSSPTVPASSTSIPQLIPSPVPEPSAVPPIPSASAATVGASPRRRKVCASKRKRPQASSSKAPTSKSKASSSKAPSSSAQTAASPVPESSPAPPSRRAASSSHSQRAAGKRPIRPEEAAEPPVADRGEIVFRDDDQKKRYEVLSKRKIINTRYLDSSTLVQLGLFDDITWLLRNLGWDTFMNMASPTHIALTLEILSSVYTKFTGRNNEIFMIHFRLQNKEFSITLQEFNSIYGFPSDVSIYTRSTVSQIDDFWRSISGEDRFNSKNARASAISNPCLRYTHRLLSNTIFARGDGDCLTRQAELLFLWSMLNQSPLNTGFFLAKHLVHVGKTTKGSIAVGGLLTPLALHCGYNPFGTAEATGSRRIDIAACIAMRIIFRQGDVYHLILRGSSQTIPLPCTARTTIRSRENWHLTAADDSATPSAGLGAGPSTSRPPPRGPQDLSTHELLQLLHGQNRQLLIKVERIEEFLTTRFPGYPGGDDDDDDEDDTDDSTDGLSFDDSDDGSDSRD